jgi:hypothetical protein
MPRSRYLIHSILVFSLAAAARPGLSQGRGQGGIVIKNNTAIYASDQGDKLEKGVERVERGFPVAGITVVMGFVNTYMAETENGRAHILFMGDGKTRNALRHRAWVDPKDVAFFTYECGCGETKEPCAPVVTAGWTTERWNQCFLDAYNKKLDELKEQWAKEEAAEHVPTASASPSGPIEKALTNADVVALFKAGLGDELIVSKIQQARTETLDVSVEALIQLKNDGVSKAILDAMVKKASARK